MVAGPAPGEHISAAELPSPGYPWPPLPSVCTVPGARAASSLEFHGGAGSRGALAALVSPALERNVRESARSRTESAQQLCAALFSEVTFPTLLGGAGCPSHPISRAVCHLLNLLLSSLPAGLLWMSWALLVQPRSTSPPYPPGKRDVGQDESISSPLRASRWGFGRAQLCPRRSWSRARTLPLLNINCIPACVQNEDRSWADSSDKELAGLKDSI